MAEIRYDGDLNNFMVVFYFAKTYELYKSYPTTPLTAFLPPTRRKRGCWVVEYTPMIILRVRLLI